MEHKGIVEWAKDLKSNREVAEKFVNVKTIDEILSIAKENGYEFTENELMDFNLEAVAGGKEEEKNKLISSLESKAKDLIPSLGSSGGGFGSLDIKTDIEVITQVANASANAIGQGSSITSNPSFTFNANK